MKKFFALRSVLVLCPFLFSFSTNRGGDVLQIFLNGRQVHQQFVQNDKTVKTLHLANLNPNDRIAVFYSHCGYAGKNRMLVFKNEKNQVVKEMKFPDAASNQSLMQFQQNEVSKNSSGTTKLYYSSNEMPQARWIATLTWAETKASAKTALL
jgi:hypothetical protein